MDDKDVIVPMGIYKIVTVFSTFIAAAMVVGGFIILDKATWGATVPIGEINVILAVLGIGVIVLGAGIYVFSTRFRTDEMGNPKNGAN